MSGLIHLLPPLTPDLGGAASVLEPLGGLVVFHDAAGCLENYVVYDEPRLAGSGALVCSSSLIAIDAITGNDEPLIDGILTAAAKLQPNFLAVIGTPVPAVTGMDLDGIAAVLAQRSGRPAMAVNCSGFHPYWQGAGEALLKLAKLYARPQLVEAGSVNLLGATPLDLTDDMLAYVTQLLTDAGWHVRLAATMQADITQLSQMPAAQLNLVVSQSGLPAAKYLQQKFQTPYRCLLPLCPQQAETLRLSARKTERKEAVIAAEPILAASLADLLQQQDIAAAILPLIEDEEIIRQQLAQASLVIADPLYQPLCAEGTVFYPLPHAARSSHLFSKIDPMASIRQILHTADLSQGGKRI